MALLALAASAAVACVGIAATINPGRFVLLDAIDLPITYWAAGWLLFVAAAVLARPRRRWVLLLTLPVLAVAYITFVGAVLLTAFAFDARIVALADDGRHEVRLVEFADIDPWWEVRLRVWPGPLARERVVLRGEEGPPPVSVRFTGPRTVEVVDSEGGVYAATF